MAQRFPSRMLLPFWVRQLSGKPVAFTPPDSEFDTPRIHIERDGYATDLLPPAAASRVCRIHSELERPACRIACLICAASGGVTLAAKRTPFAFCVPSFGLPAFFFIINVNKYVASNVIYVNIFAR